METNDEIEMLLWEYIDGTCSETDMQRISALVAHDAQWQQKYQELIAFQTSISDSRNLEQPSMRFTKNVMEAVATINIAPATKKYINKNIIRGIAAFFIAGITTLLGYAFANVNWGDNSTSYILPKINFDQLHFSNYFNSSTFSAIIAANVVLGLVLLDSYLRRKRKDLSPTRSEARPAKPFGREEGGVK